jgi:tyrosyl-tRNA synthetase
MLTAQVVQANAQTYMDQFFLVVDKDKTEIRWQSEWFTGFKLADVFNLTSRFTLADLLAHETFRKRWDEKKPLSIMELMYPLLQGYDSVAMTSDVEFGGTDQKFNILAGRQLQASMGLAPQSVFLWPLLGGLDGRKMSKSFGNTIDLTDPPAEMYGKVMSIADSVLLDYFTLATDVPEAEIAEMRRAMDASAVNPRDLKMRLGREITAMFHGAGAATSAEGEFVRVFQQRQLPTDMPTVALSSPTPVVDALVAAGLASSRSEARRLVAQGGVEIGGERVSDAQAMVPATDGLVLQVGKRRFVRVKAGL